MAIPAYSRALLIFKFVFVIINLQGATADNSGHATFYTGPATTKGTLPR